MILQLKPGLEQTGTLESVFDSAPPTPTPTAPTPRMAPMPYDPLARPHRHDSRSSKGSYYPSRQWSRQVLFYLIFCYSLWLAKFSLKQSLFHLYMPNSAYSSHCFICICPCVCTTFLQDRVFNTLASYVAHICTSNICHLCPIWWSYLFVIHI